VTPTINITKKKASKRREAEKENWEKEERLANNMPKSEIIIIAKIAPRVPLKTTIKEPIIIPRNDTYFE
tara:strand:+ start:858 stop:1064 length:207 start_codon:yes stop_codon:yes gene_type:complete